MDIITTAFIQITAMIIGTAQVGIMGFISTMSLPIGDGDNAILIGGTIITRTAGEAIMGDIMEAIMVGAIIMAADTIINI